MEKLRNKKLFLLDMDGTIYLGDRLFEGVIEFLDYIKEIGGRYLFLTNNSSKSVEKYVEKLASLGITATADDFLTSVNATEKYIDGKYKKIYVLGTTALKEQLAAYPITDEIEDDIDCLLMGFDTELTFKKLEDASILLTTRDIDYFATNPDYVCPTSYGYVPDCGSVSDMLFNATGKRPKFIGKPEPDMVYLALEKTGYSSDEAILIGDRVYTDIACGINAGIDAMLVLSGEATMDDVEKNEKKPTYIFEDVKTFLEFLKKN